MIYRLLILTLTLLILTQNVLKASANNMASIIFKDTSLNISEVFHENITINLLLLDSYSFGYLTFPNISNNYYFTQNYIGSVFPAGTKSKYQKATVEYEKGNVASSQQKWTEALEYYEKAVKIYPDFIFARVNIPLIHYQCGDKLEAIKEMRYLVKKYPMSPDIRAALTAILWSTGQEGEAKSHWVSAVGMNDKYKNLDWIQTKRFWPPKIIMALDDFFNSK